MKVSSYLSAATLALLFTGCSNHLEINATESATAPSPEAVVYELPLEIHWARNSAEHKALFEQIYSQAARELATLTAGMEPGTWAVSLDADETVLDNSQFQKEQALNGEGYRYPAWEAWRKRREADALPGARDFIKRVKELGGVVFIVTNTDISMQEDTEVNLDALGIEYDVVLCRDGREDGEKERRWNAIADGTASDEYGPLEIVMWVGDNIKDFPDLDQYLRDEDSSKFQDFGKRYIILPNPMYGSWPWNPKD